MNVRPYLFPLPSKVFRNVSSSFTKLSVSSDFPPRSGAPGYSQSTSRPSYPTLLVSPAGYNRMDYTPYRFINRTTLSANFCLLDASAAISPNTGCVVEPLSEKVLDHHQYKNFDFTELNIYQPPTLIQTLRSGLIDFTLAVSLKRLSGVCPSIVTICRDPGSIYAKA